MKSKIFLLVLGFLLFASLKEVSAGPAVSNVQASQIAGTKLVEITYTLQASAPCVISIRMSNNAGATWTVPVG